MFAFLTAWLSTPASAGMQQVMLESGHFSVSIDGAGSSTASNMTLQITRPTATATVHRAFASVTGVWGMGDPGVNSLTVGGVPVTLDLLEADSSVYTRFDDVTAELTAYLETLPAGTSAIPTIEGGSPGTNDGHSLFVIWEDPTLEVSSVSLSFGSALTGQNPTVTIDTLPMDTTLPGFAVDVGIGEAFSTGYYPQQSQVVINGTTVATTAGGFDDGDFANGGLYTIGGDGDGPNQERYDGTGLVTNGDTVLTVNLYGLSQDDYIVALWVWVVGAVLEDACGPDAPDADGDGVADLCDLCPIGDDSLDSDGDLLPDACDECPFGPNDIDADVDGVPDDCDLCPGFDDAQDSDGDGFPDGCEPTLDFLSPKRGPVEGGSSSLVIGRGFDPTCEIRIDGSPAPTAFLDEGTLSVEPLPHAAGLFDVSVLCDGGGDVLIGGYSYYDETSGDGIAPDLQQVTPNQVDVLGGAEVLLEGLGFSPDAAVDVDGVPVDATVLDDNRIEIVVPPHEEGVAAITVTNGDGLSDRLDGALLYVTGLGGGAGEEDKDDGDIALPEGCSGCASTDGTGAWLVGGLLVLLSLRRRRAAAVLATAGLAACSEYDIGAETKPTVADPQPPVAITGPALETTRDTPVTLDGTASFLPGDPEAVLEYTWTVLGGDGEIDDPSLGQPEFSASELGSYNVLLQVTADGLTSSNPAAQVVQIVPWQDLEVTLTWSEPIDLDLHLVHPDGSYATAGDCFFGNPAPDWGTDDLGADDPQLSQDDDGAGPDRDTYGPERIVLAQPPEGILTVIVTYWNDRGVPVPVDGTVEISGAGRSLGSAAVSLGAVGDAVIVGTIDWTTLAWSEDGTATTHSALGGAPFNE